MEISSNFGFTDFFYKEMLNSLVSFSLRNTFSLDLLFKESIVYAKVCTIFSLWSFFGAGDRGPGVRARAVGQAKGWGSGNTNTPAVTLLQSSSVLN